MHKCPPLHLDLSVHRSYETSHRLNGRDHARGRGIQKPEVNDQVYQVKTNK